MPLYEYECDACGQRVEVIQKFSDLPPEACAACGKGPLLRMASSPAIQFKGSGFYITDYAQKGKSDSGGAQEGKQEGKAEKSEKADGQTGGKTDGKTEGKTEGKTDGKTDGKTGKKGDSSPAASSPPPSSAKS